MAALFDRTSISTLQVQALAACLGLRWPSPIPPCCAKTWPTSCVPLTSSVAYISVDTGCYGMNMVGCLCHSILGVLHRPFRVSRWQPHLRVVECLSSSTSQQRTC